MSDALEAGRVIEIREALGWSQAELARQMDVDPETVRNWERGSRNCSGPARRLLLLLERDPGVLSVLTQEPDRLPDPDPMLRQGSPAWLRLQRVLGIIGQRNHGDWNTVRVEERLSPDWISDAEAADLIRLVGPSYATHWVTDYADEVFRLREWRRWVKAEHQNTDTTKIPLMPVRLLESAPGLEGSGSSEPMAPSPLTVALQTE
jgi:transcriptional regulator with XRE-family HTH domain